MKIGMQEKGLLDDLHVDANTVFNTCCDLRKTFEVVAPCLPNERVKRQDVIPGQMIRMQTSQRIQSQNKLLSTLRSKDYIAELKLDGERFQLHRDGDKVYYFSRTMNEHGPRGYDVFDTVVKQQVVSPTIILDGELVIWHTGLKQFVQFGNNKTVINKAIYLALGVNLEGQKELLGLWISENEGAKFWLHTLTELQNRGVKDILIACVDGLKGFPEAIQTVFPKTKIQLCIVHMVRHSLKFVVWKDYKAVTADLKTIYQAVTEDQALLELERFSQTWDAKYPQISRIWRDNWHNLNTLFIYPSEIRKAIYTTNAIESLNSVIRKSVKKRKVFPSDESAKKVIFLAVQQASKKWTMPIHNWKLALNRFAIEFPERLIGYLI
jgi:IS1 family transposase